MKIAVVGTRGFPGVQGGVEAHCRELYPRLVKLGCAVTVYTRAPYIDRARTDYEGVRLTALSCPRSKSFEAIIHTLRATIAARFLSPDLIHVHAIGPAILVPLMRLLGMRVVMTHHGSDYERRKWGRFGKMVLRCGEWAGCRFSNEVICVSEIISASLYKKYGRIASSIPNGVTVPEIVKPGDFVRKYLLTPGKYILSVGRFVPEKGFDELIAAFSALGIAGWKLVIVGDADHADEYSSRLKTLAAKDPAVVLTGTLTGMPLAELYSNAGFFALASHHEGMSIVLLEALSYGLRCIASAIPANMIKGMPEDAFFAPGNIEELGKKIRVYASGDVDPGERDVRRSFMAKNYNWNDIAYQTYAVYRNALRKGRP